MAQTLEIFGHSCQDENRLVELYAEVLKADFLELDAVASLLKD